MPASCPSCGVILAKVAQRLSGDVDEVNIGRTRSKSRNSAAEATVREGELSSLRMLLLNEDAEVDPVTFWSRAVLWTLFGVWGIDLIAQDYRTGEIGASFIHRPLLIFHEAGHVIFGVLGEWLMMLGGTLGQLVMPAILGGALLIKNRDPFGASIGLWFFGVSLLDIAPYMYDALHPQLMLLSGTTGEDGGHDWIYLFSSVGQLAKAQHIGNLVHKLAAITVLASMAWGGKVLWIQHARLSKGN